MKLGEILESVENTKEVVIYKINTDDVSKLDIIRNHGFDLNEEMIRLTNESANNLLTNETILYVSPCYLSMFNISQTIGNTDN